MAIQWTIKHIHNLVKLKFQKWACNFQIKVSWALYEKQNNVVGVAVTGSGKTLSFWIPLLMALEEGLDKMIIVVTPLNLLGKQNVDLLATAGISSVAIDAKNTNKETFRVSFCTYLLYINSNKLQAVEAGNHRVEVVNPEILMQEGGHFEKLWKKPSFISWLLYFVFDEGHCIKEWSSFCTQYRHISSLHYLIPETIPFYVVSATLPSPLLLDVADILHLCPDHTTYILHSNDCRCSPCGP